MKYTMKFYVFNGFNQTEINMQEVLESTTVKGAFEEFSFKCKTLESIIDVKNGYHVNAYLTDGTTNINVYTIE